MVRMVKLSDLGEPSREGSTQENYPDGDYKVSKVEVVRKDRETGQPILKFSEKTGNTLLIKAIVDGDTNGPLWQMNMGELAVVANNFGVSLIDLPFQPPISDAGKVSEYINTVVNLINESGGSLEITSKGGFVNYFMQPPLGAYIFEAKRISSKLKGTDKPGWVEKWDKKTFNLEVEVKGFISINEYGATPAGEVVKLYDDKKQNVSAFLKRTPYYGSIFRIRIDYDLKVINVDGEDILTFNTTQSGKVTATANRHHIFAYNFAVEVFGKPVKDINNNLPECDAVIRKNKTWFHTEVTPYNGKHYHSTYGIHNIEDGLGNLSKQEIQEFLGEVEEYPEPPTVFPTVSPTDEKSPYKTFPLHLQKFLYFTWAVLGRDVLKASFINPLKPKIGMGKNTTDLVAILTKWDEVVDGQKVSKKLSTRDLNLFNAEDIKAILEEMSAYTTDHMWNTLVENWDYAIELDSLPFDFLTIDKAETSIAYAEEEAAF